MTRRHPNGPSAGRRTTTSIALVAASLAALAALAVGAAPAGAEGPQQPGPDALVATSTTTPTTAGRSNPANPNGSATTTGAGSTGSTTGTSTDGAAAPTTVSPASAALPLPTPATAARGTFGPPEWLPLRRNVTGTEVTVGCTFDSHGSGHGYECAGHHDRWAIDFMADPGTPVYAAGAGFATNLTGKPGGSGFGNVVRIDHGFGVSTVYAHLTTAMVPAQGEWVDQDTQIGTVGSTGSASAPHLHFERFAVPSAEQSGYYDQTSVDPGPLWACRGSFLVSFPQVAGFDSWKGLPWGSLTVASDGSACARPAALLAPAEVDAPGSAAADATDAGDGPSTTVVAPRTRRFSAERDDPATA
ncbi:MAG: M23 family metallopeptidase [Acidimicrobiales bacterium]